MEFVAWMNQVREAAPDTAAPVREAAPDTASPVYVVCAVHMEFVAWMNQVREAAPDTAAPVYVVCAVIWSLSRG
eukprot:1161824-Pelagomonas_calceolata.AAC.11